MMKNFTVACFLYFVFLAFATHAAALSPAKIDSLSSLAEKAYRGGNYPVAAIITQDLMRYYHESVQPEKELKQTVFLAEVQRAAMHFISSEHNLALAFTLAKKLNDHKNLVYIQNRKSALHFESGRFRDAFRDVDEAIALSEKYHVNDYLASTLNIKAALLRDIDKVPEALKIYYRALGIAKQTHDGDEEITICYNLAIVHMRARRPDSLRYYANRALHIAYSQNRASRLVQGYQLLAGSYELPGETTRRDSLMKRADAVYDSLYTKNAKEQQEFVEAAYMSPIKEKENVLLKKLNSEIRSTLFIVGALCLLLLLAMFYIFKRNKLLRQLNVKLHAQQLSIENQNKELAALNTVKDKLFSIVAHDLRNPIHSLVVSLSFLNEGELDEEERTFLMKNMEKGSLHVQEMLENLLRWSGRQLRGESIIKDKLSVEELVKENIALLRSMAANKNIAVRFEPAPHQVAAYADVEMIRFVIRNLLTNAIKFTKAGGHITIHVAHDNASVITTIKDDGIGMTEEKLNSLFTIRGEGTYGTENERGTGLGLALCKEFVEKNEGSIRVTSEEGNGSTFSITLPLANT